MFLENEIVMIILGIATLIFIFINHKRIKKFPSSAIFLSSFYVLFAGWIFTVLEGVLFPELFNLLEHLCYALSSVLLTVWCWQVFYKKKDAL